MADRSYGRTRGARLLIVRFTTPSTLLIGEDHWDTPAIDPGQGYRYEVRHMALNGITEFRCTVSDVLIRN